MGNLIQEMINNIKYILLRAGLVKPRYVRIKK
jgi:hypothetical protein